MTSEQAADLADWCERFENGLPRGTGFGQPICEMSWGSPMAVDLAIAEAAWHRLGAVHLATRTAAGTCWALQRFGEPKGGKHVR